MSPRVAKKDRGELPKPQVKAGTLGFCPINALTLSYRHRLIGDVLLNFEATAEQAINRQNSFKIQTASDKMPETIDISGISFKGLSDALYRGRLPQVLVMAPEVDALSALVTEVLDYVEKMISLGFFLQPNPVDIMIPNIIIVSNGVFFNRLMTSLGHQLQKMPNLPNHLHVPILSKFYRGFLDMAEPISLSLQEPVQMIQPPIKIRIAASNHQWKKDRHPNLEAVQSVLSLHGLITVLENTVPNAVERLELEHALSRSSEAILPTLIQSQNLPSRDAKNLADRVYQGILRIGRHLMAFDDLEPPRTLPVLPKACGKKSASSDAVHKKDGTTPAKSKTAKAQKDASDTGLTSQIQAASQLTVSDLTITDSLRHYAETLGLSEERELFDQLNRQLYNQLQQ